MIMDKLVWGKTDRLTTTTVDMPINTTRLPLHDRIGGAPPAVQNGRYVSKYYKSYRSFLDISTSLSRPTRSGWLYKLSTRALLILKADNRPGITFSVAYILGGMLTRCGSGSYLPFLKKREEKGIDAGGMENFMVLRQAHVLPQCYFISPWIAEAVHPSLSIRSVSEPAMGLGFKSWCLESSLSLEVSAKSFLVAASWVPHFDYTSFSPLQSRHCMDKANVRLSGKRPQGLPCYVFYRPPPYSGVRRYVMNPSLTPSFLWFAALRALSRFHGSPSPPFSPPPWSCNKEEAEKTEEEELHSHTPQPSQHHLPRGIDPFSFSASMTTPELADGLSREPVKRDRHPPWHPPVWKDPKGLWFVNSLTECPEAFAPRTEGGAVRWYTCGPTVYDLSHLGHARAYLTFDIIRRVMEDYFGYAVIYQMNITDIDDKIIKRARTNCLLAGFKARTLHGEGMAGLREFTQRALKAAADGLAGRRARLSLPLPADASSRVRAERAEKLLELELKEGQFTETTQVIVAAAAGTDFEALFDAASGVNGELLDQLEGHAVVDQKIFEEHARFYERTFFDDMARLGIREPDVITRVTEYVPQVVAFIQKVLANGFAYQGTSSIFFDTEAFVREGYDYPKLKPGGDREATEEEMAEGEGALSKDVEGEKRSPNDFALWKFSKPGEPRWPSPWGEGRPGWHIECSVMASDILGDNIDIHSGGWDLKFPHHDNECAQSEAFGMKKQWVNYFMHCGHLHIKGLKMSKSLKNFITIRQCLDELGVSPREMRLLFLSNPWNRPMNFSDQSLDEASEKARILRAFFGNVDVILRGDSWAKPQGADAHDRELLEHWATTERGVHEALRNNFDTPTALALLMSLVASTNRYMLCPERPSATLLRKVARYITRIFQVFGVVEGNDAVGLSRATPHGVETPAAEGRLAQVMDALVRFRDDVREVAKREKLGAAFLPLCDHLRDEALVDAGLRVEDNPTGPTTWRNDEPAALRKELMARREKEEMGRRVKLQNQIETREKQLTKWRQFRYDPTEFFARQDGERRAGEKKFSAFDPATGLPSRLANGEVVLEKDIKKYQKEVAKYAKQYEEFRAKGGLQWLEQQQEELGAMLKDLERSK
ncbi:unnamed protein product [Phytomonas sp. Hart1]|nr:unnamed protein product [Phytomonas sp. Hart1]|eukprot:CCW66666.1 unnamed protein product [Phytomonas sp. isolate Hart1]